MHIFKNTNYDFLRWRWHAVALSWVVILAGVVVIYTKGIPRGIEFAGGTSLITQFDQPVSIEQVRTALDRRLQGKRHPVLRQPGTASGADSRAAERRRVGRRAEPDQRRGHGRAATGQSREVRHRRHRNREPDGWPRADEQGHLGDRAVAGRHPCSTSRSAISSALRSAPSSRPCTTCSSRSRFWRSSSTTCR